MQSMLSKCLQTVSQTEKQSASDSHFFKPRVFQPKLSINSPSDIYEQEAGAMADTVMRITDNSPHKNTFFKPAINQVQRKPQQHKVTGDEEKEELKTQSVNDDVIGHGVKEPAHVPDSHKENKVETPSGRANAGIICKPKPVLYSEFLAETGNVNNAFGITKPVNETIGYPEIVLENHKLRKTTAGMQVNSFFLKDGQSFSDDGVFILPANDKLQGTTGCSNTKYKRNWNILPDTTKIEKGEQEHCDDYETAFILSLAKFRDAINEAAAADKEFESVEIAKRSLKLKTQVDPDLWRTTFTCLTNKTIIRDGGAKHPIGKPTWHSPTLNPKGASLSCEYAEQNINDSSFPNIGNHPPSEIINDCK